MNCNKTTEDQQPKGQAKAKSLSLQQYRQLRQRRQPLVEKQGNNTTKWPSVPEPPKELTPILCLQKQNSCRPKTAHHYPDLRKPDYMSSCRVSSTHRLQPSEARSSTHSRLNRQSTESKVISPTSPLAGGIVPERKKSPVKKPTPLSSDPPNPVLLPLPVLQIASPSTSNSSSASKVEFSSRDSSLQGNRQLQEIHNESSAATLQRQTFSSELNPQVSALIKDCNQESTALLQDMKTVFTEIPPDDSSTSQEQKTSQCIKPQIQKCSLSSLKDSQPLARTPPALSPDTKRPIKCSSVTPHFSQPLQSHIDASGSATEVQTHSMSPPEEPPPPQSGCRVQGATAGSGIEASDLTSLLEQFEETQAKEEGVCENEPALVRAASLPLMPSVGPLESLSTSETQKLQTLEGMDVPEPLSTEIILSTQQPARRKNPLSKVIQIIDPRPLPSRKTHTTPSESRATRASPHMYAHISSDHDYCGSVDHSPANAFQRSRAKPSLLKDASQTTNDQHMMTQDLNAAGEEKTQITTVLLHHSEQPRTRSEIDKALQFANCATTEDNRTSGNKTAPCTFPTPPPSPPVRGREKRRYRRRSPRSDSSSGSRSSSSSSSSSSASRSPKRLRLHHKRSESSSCSSSPSCSVSRSPPRRYRSRRYTSRSSRSRSRSWSTSRSRSPSPQICCRRWRDFCSRESRKLRREHDMRIQKLKAIDERRVVYVGRIRRSMTHDELRERFSQFGEVECVSLHFRDRGDHYGFVTFYNMEDAFAAIDNGGKLRQPDELPFDICFGGRRQFCSSDYTDLDANRDAEASPSRTRFEDLDFDSLLKQAQRGSKR
ncbi:peroxisome proliferator-activated receptor gamma coactivator-related protein 1 isoform X2 [Archocentrus centrarchus]|uniref:peroxisome proliferator-activated receptor gamma coactivator-related protein 1 isoform X2 n=1 Tax=Archocentrus centrarchus TaxID=63155 RepID=UPI0011E9D0A8|nr:peroxisome proliferator-activated receptor gamma coactivator-related protein 1-like isoform X2 [Archocentrus centrarchus]